MTRNLILIPLLLWLAGCALAPPGEDQGFRAGPADAAAPVLPPPGTPRAVLTLIGQARAAMEAGDPLTAAARLERALRIEPRNPVLWHYMAPCAWPGISPNGPPVLPPAPTASPTATAACRPPTGASSLPPATGSVTGKAPAGPKRRRNGSQPGCSGMKK